MSRPGTWFARAEAVIAQVVGSFPSGTDRAQVLKAIDAAYPFGQRKHWPYKCWLDARRRWLGLPPARRRRGARASETGGAPTLFEEGAT